MRIATDFCLFAISQFLAPSFPSSHHKDLVKQCAACKRPGDLRAGVLGFTSSIKNLQEPVHPLDHHKVSTQLIKIQRRYHPPVSSSLQSPCPLGRCLKASLQKTGDLDWSYSFHFAVSIQSFPSPTPSCSLVGFPPFGGLFKPHMVISPEPPDKLPLPNVLNTLSHFNRVLDITTIDYDWLEEAPRTMFARSHPFGFLCQLNVFLFCSFKKTTVRKGHHKTKTT